MRHVLVVDDSPVIRKIVRRVLEGMDLEITEASDVRQALAVCSLSMPDAIFVDGGMPTLDGCEFLRKLRRMHGGDGPKAIICLNENDVRHRKGANRERLTHIRGFGNLEVHALENTADNLSDHGGVVHH